jgi:hypothetical protein
VCDGKRTAVPICQLVSDAVFAPATDLDGMVLGTECLGELGAPFLENPLVIQGLLRSGWQVIPAKPVDVAVDIGIGPEALGEDGVLPFARKDEALSTIPQNKDDPVLGLVGVLVVNKGVIEASLERRNLGIESTIRLFAVLVSQFSVGSLAAAPAQIYKRPDQQPGGEGERKEKERLTIPQLAQQTSHHSTPFRRRASGKCLSLRWRAGTRSRWKFRKCGLW